MISEFIGLSPDRRLRLLLDTCVPFVLPLRVPFRGVVAREGLLLKGPAGWGEFAPFVEYDATVAARWLSAAIEAAWGQWPKPLRHEVPVNAIIPAVPAAVAAELVREAFRRDGTTTIKVKVGAAGAAGAGAAGAVAADVERVAAVREALVQEGVSDGRIRIDVNAAWTVEQAIRIIPRLAEAAGDLEYVEQPCRSLEELTAVRAAVDVPIAADESIRTARDPAAAVRAADIDVAIIKVAPLGGVAAALRVAQACGVPVVVSGAMDSAIGLGAGLALAAALPELSFACGLGTGALLECDVTAKPLRPTGGRLLVGRQIPDPRALAAASERMPGPRQDWWRRRLAKAWLAGANQYSGHWLEARADRTRSQSVR